MEVNLFKLSWERSLNLSFTNIRGLYFDFLACESFLKSKLLIFLLYVRQTWKTQLSRVGGPQLIQRVLLLLCMFLQFT